MIEIPISKELINRMLEAQGQEPISESDYEKHLQIKAVHKKYTDLTMEKIKEVINEYANKAALEIIEIVEVEK